LGATSTLTGRSGRWRLVPELTRRRLRPLLTEAGLCTRLYGPLDHRGVLIASAKVLGTAFMMRLSAYDGEEA